MSQEPALDLAFRAGSDGSTALARRRVRYPFSVQAPVRDVRERPRCSRVFVQSASGGIFASEEIGQRIVAKEGAEVRIEMPAAAVVHSMKSGESGRQRIELVGEAGSVLEYLPRPLILFPGSRLAQVVEVVAAKCARMLICDGFMMHDPAASDGVFDRFDSKVEVRQPDGQLILDDRSSASGTAIRARTPGTTGHCAALGSVMMLGRQQEGAGAERCRELQALLAGTSGIHAGATTLRRQAGLLVRMLAADGGALADAQAAAIRMMRDMLHG